MKNEYTCPVCDHANLEVQGAYRGRHQAFLGLHLAHCLSCDLVFASPMPSEPALMGYNANYFESAHGGQTQDSAAVSFFTGIAHLRCNHLEQFIDKLGINISKILEVGPGLGYFAQCWLERYPETAYFALETDKTCHASLSKKGVSVLEDASCSLIDGNVDLVVLSHVLEHVSDPRSFLKYVTHNLRPGGVLFIEVPCRDWEHKPFDEPHLLFFDKQPMRCLLEGLGFNDMELSYHGQEIAHLNSLSWLRAKWLSLRTRFIKWGCVAPFGYVRHGMECLTDPMQRAVIAPYMAHKKTDNPAWWLRALSVKSKAI